MKPFLKWAGGKGQLISELLKRMPKSFGRYHEPFVGAGALFFAQTCAFRPTRLSDSNAELMATYIAIRNYSDQVIEALREHAKIYTRIGESYFYQVRNQPVFGLIEKAARMIFLNKTCFNGLYRVNKKGGFNVPHGKYKNPTICDKETIKNASRALTGVVLVTEDFRDCEVHVCCGDFVYFDPPYVPISKTSNFRSYTSEGFSWKDQQDLADLAVRLRDKGAHVLLSNSSGYEVVDLYAKRGFNIEAVSARRAINSKSNRRGAIQEFMIRA